MSEESEEIIYTLSALANSYVDEDIESMDEWLSNMSDEELNAYYLICNKRPSQRSDKEDYEIGKYALILYCRELGLDELAISNDLIVQITGAFCINVIIESLRRRGMAKTDGPLLLYKNCTISLTDKGKEIADKIVSDEDENIHECKVCGEPFKTSEELYKHYDEKHNKEEE